MGLDWAGWLRYTLDVLDVFSTFGHYIIKINVDKYDCEGMCLGPKLGPSGAPFECIISIFGLHGAPLL